MHQLDGQLGYKSSSIGWSLAFTAIHSGVHPGLCHVWVLVVGCGCHLLCGHCYMAIVAVGCSLIVAVGGCCGPLLLFIMWVVVVSCHVYCQWW